jgi:hypothetical protein
MASVTPASCKSMTRVLPSVHGLIYYTRSFAAIEAARTGILTTSTHTIVIENVGETKAHLPRAKRMKSSAGGSIPFERREAAICPR